MSGLPTPAPLVGVKLASVAVHAEELIEAGHPLDVEAIRGLLADQDVQAYFRELRALALLPVKRRIDL